jgi:predicted site-specific integrase-resolvase
MNGKTYTIKELSQITGYSVNTIRGYIKSTKIRAYLVDGRYQVDQAEAERVFRVGKKLVALRIPKMVVKMIPVW